MSHGMGLGRSHGRGSQNKILGGYVRGQVGVRLSGQSCAHTHPRGGQPDTNGSCSPGHLQ